MASRAGVGFGEDPLSYEAGVEAARDAMAEAGEILCGFATYALVADRVRAETRALLEMYGIARPVEAYTILGLVD